MSIFTNTVQAGDLLKFWRFIEELLSHLKTMEQKKGVSCSHSWWRLMAFLELGGTDNRPFGLSQRQSDYRSTRMASPLDLVRRRSFRFQHWNSFFLHSFLVQSVNFYNTPLRGNYCARHKESKRKMLTVPLKISSLFFIVPGTSIYLTGELFKQSTWLQFYF